MPCLMNYMIVIAILSSQIEYAIWLAIEILREVGVKSGLVGGGFSAPLSLNTLWQG